MFIETEQTPNPDTLKFLPFQTIMEQGTLEFQTIQDAENKSPLATALFRIEGVRRIFFGHDFISITKDSTPWAHLKPAILGTIMEHFVENRPLFYDMKAPSHESLEEFYEEKDQDVVTMIKELIETRIRPAVAHDGGDVQFHGYKEGKVYLYMRGACAGCPSASATLKHGIENLLRHFIPDIVSVEATDFK